MDERATAAASPRAAAVPAGAGPLGRRQFVLRTHPGPAPEGYREHALPGAWLHACPELPVLRVEGPGGRVRVLLGVAVCGVTGTVPVPVDGAGTGQELAAVDEVASQLARLTSPQLQEAYREWSGRWLLLDGDEVHLDATGMLSAFWREGAVASSPALLTRRRHEGPPLHRDLVLPFMPGPATGLEDLRRLLPAQVLSWRTWQVRSRPVLRVQEVDEQKAPAVLERAAARLLASVERSARLGPLVVPLTAGHDSRLALAACVHLGLRPRLVTQLYPGMARADVRLPPLMAQRLGLPHELVRPGARRPAAADLYDAQVGGLVRETDRYFLEHGQFGWMRAGDVVLRGTAFDGTRRGAHDLLDGLPLDADALGPALGASPDQQAALAEWVALVRDDPQPLSTHDRFWLDQKCASYAATTELALDLMGAHSVLPGNSTAYQELMLSLPWSWRRQSLHHKLLISRWAPAIADVPYNPPRKGMDKLARIPGALRRRWRAARASGHGTRG